MKIIIIFLKQIVQSTESTASTSGGSGLQTTISLPIGGVEPIPRKQDIQQDIRFNRGRFKLVRKRGRSEVWNLFGQVVDTLTNSRLPYVACYACKILYTDTGGGTGNMTRHRCQVGNILHLIQQLEMIQFHLINLLLLHLNLFEGVNTFNHQNNDLQKHSSSSTSPQQNKQQELLIQQQQQTQEQNLRLLAQQHQRKVAAVAAAAILLEQQQRAANLIASKGVISSSSLNSTTSSSSSTSSGFQSFSGYNNGYSSSSSIEQQQQLIGGSISSYSIPPSSQPPPLIFNKLFNNKENINSSSSSSSSPANSFSLISPAAAAAACCILQQQQPFLQSNEIIRQQEEKQLQHFNGLLSTISPISIQPNNNSHLHPPPLPPPPHSSSSSSSQGINFYGEGSTSSLIELNNNKNEKKEEEDKEEILFSGHHFTSADRQLFSQAVINFCSQDLLKWEIVEGEGFQNLVETLLFIGRRSSINKTTKINKKQQQEQPQQFDSIKKQLIQTGNEIKKIFLNQKQIVFNETKNDIEKLKNIGISLNCHQIEYGGELKYIISTNYITDDWRITRRILKVSSLKELNEINNQLIINKLTFQLFEFKLDNCPLIILTIDEDIEIINNNKEKEEYSLLNYLPSNIYLFNNINKELNNVLKKCLITENTINNEEIIKIINLINQLIKILIKLNFEYYYDFTNLIYPSLKFIRENCSDILIFLEENLDKEKEENNLIIELQNINWQLFYELESFLEPFYETSQMFLDLNNPHFNKILPEWFALIHECQLNQQLIKEEEKEEELNNNNNNIQELFRSIKLSANLYLKEWANSNISIEHRVATALNPRLRHLPLICSDSERLCVYERIREMAGLGNKLKQKEENFSNKNEQQPFRKRRRFLDQLEDCTLNEEDDELDFYLKSTFTHSQTSDILEFWSSFGEEQFPNLAKLARFLLSISFTPITTKKEINNGNLLNSNEIEILLNLRPKILNSVNHQLAHHRIQQQKQFQNN
ncbi:hypothetical protein Mgra_00001960 [Meloidogyne graminicola]|uniref:BED-type domain-containing protein n=1 Tax=Meloidogyne graminicola TaxID=189291 RepID=A0A8S9ZZ82_9BILA|nr:hypothetical protein Mgra_00001960 [Meloidogyne graminicola]